MSEQPEPQLKPGEQQARQAVGAPAPSPKPTALQVDESRDEFIRNAQPVADALRRRGREVEAAQLEQAAKVIGQAVGTPPPALADETMKGESVSTVLKNIWDVMEKDPEIRKMPQAQNLRKAGLALERAGLLTITVRDGVIVSFISNFADNFNEAQKAVRTNELARSPVAPAMPIQPASASGSQGQSNPAPEPVVTPPAATSLLTPDVMEKAKEMFQKRNQEATRHTVSGTGFTLADLPSELLAKMGVSIEELQKSGQLHKLLSGQKTDLISSFALRNGQGEEIPFAAKLVLRRDAEGAPSLQFDLPKHRLVIPEQILGKEITPQMKEQLQTNGVVPLSEGFRDSKGQTFAAYVALDQEMNRVVAVRREGIAVPRELLGVTLSPQQNQQLLAGYPTPVAGMTNRKSQLFDATVVLDPVKRTLSFRDVQPHSRQQQTEQVGPGATRPRMRM